MRGFTLIELLLVLAIVAIASVGVTLSMRDASQSQLDGQAQRLAAMLEAARAQSRASGLPVYWRALPDGFAINNTPHTWAHAGIHASSEQPVLLGPEPLIAPQRIRLWHTEQPQRSLILATDGVRPFFVQGEAP